MLKEIRQNAGITIEEASKIVGVPFRTYYRYEQNENYGNALKRSMIEKILQNEFEITETKGILTIEKIKMLLYEVFSKKENDVEFCFLFGSYAKGYAKENSDVDLCVSTSLKGLDFVGLIEEIRQKLHKEIHLLRFGDLANQQELLKEILKDGIKIYG